MTETTRQNSEKKIICQLIENTAKNDKDLAEHRIIRVRLTKPLPKREWEESQDPIV